MPCLHPIPIKSVGYQPGFGFDKYTKVRLGADLGFVPCGECEECRIHNSMSWQWRLNAEFESLKKSTTIEWHFAFVTLTYGTSKGGFGYDHCPSVPFNLLKTDSSGKLPNGINPMSAEFKKQTQCFNREHCQTWIKDIRKYLFRNYWIGRKEPKVKRKAFEKDFKCYENSNIKYILCAEYGGEKGRSHYHAILAFPMINGLTDEVMFNLCREHWYGVERTYKLKNGKEWTIKSLKHGFMFPRDLHGGYVNPNGSVEKPFIIESSQLSKAVSYASKYVCKDLTFKGKLQGLPIDRTNKEWKNYDCFHLQSRSLGLSVLTGLDDSQKLDLIKNGKVFDAFPDKGYQPIPTYIRNKLIFNYDYVLEPSLIPVKYDVDTGEVIDDKDHTHTNVEIHLEKGFKRLVRKSANEFYKRHVKEIYNKQHNFYVKMFKEMQEESYWIERQVMPDTASKIVRTLRQMSTYRTFDLHRLADWYLCYFRRPTNCLVTASRYSVYLSRYDVDTYNSIRVHEPIRKELAQYWNDLCMMYVGTLRFISRVKTEQEKLLDELGHQYKEIGLHYV